jgi:hypothetical protein
MQYALVYDLHGQGGPDEILTHSINATEMIARDPERYTRTLPPNVKVGPRSGPDRIILY